MDKTKIEWTDATFNPWIGCTEVSPACANCYARALSNFRGWAEWGNGKPRHRTSEANWKKPLQWNRVAEKTGEPLKVFCASLADYLDSDVPKEWRHDLFDLIENTPYLIWQLLTKRTESLVLKLPESWRCNPLPNVWLGATVESDKYTWRADDLREMPAAVHFLSCEPLLSPLDNLDLTNIDQVIAGGESGQGARPSHPDWFRSLRDKCIASGVKFLFKQWGDWVPLHEREDIGPYDFKVSARVTLEGKRGNSASLSPTEFATACLMGNVGKKAAGRLLDGLEWNQYPTAKEAIPDD